MKIYEYADEFTSSVANILGNLLPPEVVGYNLDEVEILLDDIHIHCNIQGNEFRITIRCNSIDELLEIGIEWNDNTEEAVGVFYKNDFDCIFENAMDVICGHYNIDPFSL